MYDDLERACYSMVDGSWDQDEVEMKGDAMISGGKLLLVSGDKWYRKTRRGLASRYRRSRG